MKSQGILYFGGTYLPFVPKVLDRKYWTFENEFTEHFVLCFSEVRVSLPFAPSWIIWSSEVVSIWFRKFLNVFTWESRALPEVGGPHSAIALMEPLLLIMPSTLGLIPLIYTETTALDFIFLV
jgi:hypothetical protein